MSTLVRAHQLTPKLFSLLVEGYSMAHLRRDALAGFTVAVVALPLAMALAIASGAPPEKGLVTAIIAGFLISTFGGSRYQIGGPTAAFIVVVMRVIVDHGYDGMLLATLMAGVMLILAGIFKLGTYIKYVPYPVITGFTSGIAVTIFLSQLKDLLGIPVPSHPRDAVQLLDAYAENLNHFSLPTALLGVGLLAGMLALRHYRPKWPVFLVGVGAGALVIGLGIANGQPLAIETIGSRFGMISTAPPSLTLPDFSWTKIREVFPASLTIAFLAGVEALLSAIVADGMTGGRHRSNAELVAQGIANCSSALIGGLPATGAIARTATNIRAGAYSPVAGMMHALFLLLFFLLGAPLFSYIPLAALAAVLVIVAINISEAERFRHLMQAPLGDRVVLLTTFFLTVFMDLSIAIRVGVIMAALLFMHRMAELVDIDAALNWLHDSSDEDDGPDAEEEAKPTAPIPADLPPGLEVYQISGPFFFGAAGRISDELDALRAPPRILILRMRDVPMIDASGVAALRAICEKVQRHGGEVILSALQTQPRRILEKMEVLGHGHRITVMSDFRQAMAEAQARLNAPGQTPA